MRLTHARVSLELHVLAERQGLPVLALHSLFGSATDWGEAAGLWPGPVYALDFSGHGHSQWVAGGAYTPELLAGDADAALAQIGRAAVVGAGIGAYVALLLGAARPQAVPAALLLAGAGMAGGGALPDFSRPFFHRTVDDALARPVGCDPLVRMLEDDVRPVEYAAALAAAARCVLLANANGAPPPWWKALTLVPTVRSAPLAICDALAMLVAHAR